MDNKDQIAAVAYELYLKSGKTEGRDVENWLEAERIVLARQSQIHPVPEVKPGRTEKQVNPPAGNKGTTKTKKRAKRESV